MGSPSEADVPEWAAMLSTPRRRLAAMEMDTKVQGQKAAAAATPSWRAPDKLAAALARDDSPLKDGVDEERKLQTVAFDEEERKLRDDAAEMRSAVSSLEAWREERRRETAALEALAASEPATRAAGRRAATGFEVLDLGELESLHDKASRRRGAPGCVAGLLAGEGDAAGPAPFGVLDYGGDALREAADLELRQLEENLAKLRAEAETD
ncbi:hypothetical protein JL721_1284 [Aureococcus anophagefferens]|nr:hypothetical protein JL721_1284 [Aureococcus anophagefferens]